MEDWTTKAVSIDFHHRSMSELEGNMRMLIRLLENKITSQEESIRNMLEQQSALEQEQREIQENVIMMKEKEKDFEQALKE